MDVTGVTNDLYHNARKKSILAARFYFGISEMLYDIVQVNRHLCILETYTLHENVTSMAYPSIVSNG